MTDEPAANEGWIQLLEEMDAMAEELSAEGWETLTIPAGEAGAVLADDMYTDRHGYAYVVPGNAAEQFEELFVPDGFPRTEVYRATTASHLFLLTVFLDPETGAAILLAGTLDRDSLDGCRECARATGVTYSHLFTVDGTHLGSFEHDDPEPFFPD
jgi:hypothetical protein